MTAREELLQFLSTYPNVFIPQPVLTNVGFAPIDFSRGVLQDPVALELITQAFLEEIDFSRFDVLVALPMSAISMATTLSLATKKPFVIVRDDVKRPGRPKVMGAENFLKPGDRVLMIDDWMATGLNKQNALKLLDDVQAKVTTIACLGDFDMTEDRSYLRELQNAGIKFVALVKWSELVAAQYKAGTLDKDSHELNLARLRPSDFADDSKGLLSKSVAYLRKKKIKVVPEVKEWLKGNGVNVSGV